MIRPLPAAAALVLLTGCAQDVVGFCALPVGDAPARGPEAALVTVVEFSDFQCPYCRNASHALRDVPEDLASELRVVFRNLPSPYHDRAVPAAVAAACAHEQGRFWELHDILFEHQDALGADALAAYAAEAGLDMDEWEACRASSRPTTRLDADEAEARRLGIPAVPTLFVNGTPQVGAPPPETLEADLRAALDEALASGVDRSSYYASLTERSCE